MGKMNVSTNGKYVEDSAGGECGDGVIRVLGQNLHLVRHLDFETQVVV